MLVATSSRGPRVEASHLLDPGAFTCPACSGRVFLKRGKVTTPHFAHAPGADCGSAGESARHLAAKRKLADEFRALGYTVELEEPHFAARRRVDVAATLSSGHRIAVEVQDSPISVAEAKRRTAADRSEGFVGTLWIFTKHRARHLIEADDDDEVRVPVVRSGRSSEWYDPDGELNSVSYPGRTLMATRYIEKRRVEFALTARATRYAAPGRPDWAVTCVLAGV